MRTLTLDVGLFGVKDSPNREQDYWKGKRLNKDMQVVVQRRTGEIYNKKKGSLVTITRRH